MSENTCDHFSAEIKIVTGRYVATCLICNEEVLRDAIFSRVIYKLDRMALLALQANSTGRCLESSKS